MRASISIDCSSIFRSRGTLYKCSVALWKRSVLVREEGGMSFCNYFAVPSVSKHSSTRETIPYTVFPKKNKRANIGVVAEKLGAPSPPRSTRSNPYAEKDEKWNR